jgi:16S rRNA (cytidine1402-2'-O)-methyltransferase
LRKPLVSCFHFNEIQRSQEIIQRLSAGQTVALVSDAGSPGISDPGQRLVKKVLEAGLRVEAVPGPCALIAALTASGLPTDEFHFVGFLPHKSGARRRQLESLRQVPGTLAIYESPHRIPRLLGELAVVMPERSVVMAKELTKKFEKFMRGRPSELQAAVGRSKGEWVVMIGPAEGT